MNAARALLALAVVATAAVLPRVVDAEEPQESVRILDVAYLPQNEALCGGAAAAMVMRYWGARGVYADTFAHLIDPQARGIRGSELRDALRAQGWQAVSFAGDAALVARHLDDGRPLIALIEDRPGFFHYVVVVAWAAGRVVAHDPARAPFRVYDAAAFVEAWSRSGFWTLLAIPGAGRVSEAEESGPPAPPGLRREDEACGPVTAEGTRLARAGELERAGALLEFAARACPDAPGPRRELAGLHALRRDWGGAARHARAAIALDPADAHAARILATSLFLEGDLDGALEAWNLLGEPAVDLVNVSGLERTRYRVVADLLRIHPHDLLTPARAGRARRRLQELPAAARTALSYAPVGGGRANVEAAVVERPALPSGLLPLGGVAARSVTERELSVTIASPSGSGEALTGSWRWWSARPRVAFAFSAPAPVRRAGAIWRVEAFYDRQTYDVSPVVQEAHRGGRFAVADWLTDRWRWEAALGVDRWADHEVSTAFESRIGWHSPRDRWMVGAGGSVHVGGIAARTLSLDARWRSADTREGHVWDARAGLATTGSGAPFGLWSGAGTGHGRDPLLRAHPLLDDGLVRGGVFGRTLAHGGVEWRRWIRPGGKVWRVAPAVFVDVARAAHSLAAFDTRLQVDAGAGIRLNVPGAGVLRIDAGRGLRDRAMAVSAGWTR